MPPDIRNTRLHAVSPRMDKNSSTQQSFIQIAKDRFSGTPPQDFLHLAPPRAPDYSFTNIFKEPNTEKLEVWSKNLFSSKPFTSKLLVKHVIPSKHLVCLLLQTKTIYQVQPSSREVNTDALLRPHLGAHLSIRFPTTS